MSSKSTDGGQTAIKGFLLQTLVAILKSYELTDWVFLTLEPSGPHGVFEKVDVLWTGGAGDIHAQVKHSRNPFTAGKVKKWAEELDTTSAAATKTLVLLGAATSGAVRSRRVGGVDVEFGSGDESVLLAAIADGMVPHTTGSLGAGKSQFLHRVNERQLVLDGAAYADEAGLWVGNKAKVILDNPVGVHAGTGQKTNVLNIYRNKNGFVHGAPGTPQ